VFGFFRKKKDPAAAKRLQRTLTANDLINTKDVKDCILYTRDNQLFAYIRIKPISLELLSPVEQKIKKDKLISELGDLDELQRQLVIPRPVDISANLEWLEKRHKETTNVKIKEMIRNEIQDLNETAMGGEVLEQNYFLPFSRPNKRDAEKDLLKIVNDVVGRFRACGIEASLCRRDDIVKMLHLFYNPNYSHLEDGDINEYVPFIHFPNIKEGA